MEDYARKNGFENIRHFTDDGFSGVNFNRPGFQSLIKEVEAGNVETLIVKDIMNALGVSADMIFCDVIDAGVTEKNNQLDAKVSQLSTKDRKTVYDVLDLLVRDLSK